MLKQLVMLSGPPALRRLIDLVEASVSKNARKPCVFRMIPTGFNRRSTEYYVFDNGDHVTPMFSLDTMCREAAEYRDIFVPTGASEVPIVKMDNAEDHGSVAMFSLDEAAEWIARELAEVA